MLKGPKVKTIPPKSQARLEATSTLKSCCSEVTPTLK